MVRMMTLAGREVDCLAVQGQTRQRQAEDEGFAAKRVQDSQ